MTRITERGAGQGRLTLASRPSKAGGNSPSVTLQVVNGTKGAWGSSPRQKLSARFVAVLVVAVAVAVVVVVVAVAVALAPRRLLSACKDGVLAKAGAVKASL